MSHSISASFSRSLIDLDELYAEARHEIASRENIHVRGNEAVKELKVTIEPDAITSQLNDDGNWLVIVEEPGMELEATDFFVRPETAPNAPSQTEKSEIRKLFETVVFGMIGLIKGF